MLQQRKAPLDGSMRNHIEAISPVIDESYFTLAINRCNTVTLQKKITKHIGEIIMDFKTDRDKTWLEDENGKQIALLDHPEVRPGVVNLVHTEVDPSMNGQGIAGKMTEFVADKLRSEGIKAELSCSYSIRWFSKHPEYSDILADPETEAKDAAALGGPACGIRR